MLFGTSATKWLIEWIFVFPTNCSKESSIILTTEIQSRFLLLKATPEQSEAAASDLRFAFMYFGVVYQSMLHALMEKLNAATAPLKTI